ncbi:MAG: hypothetical protein RMJ37_02210 [Spirochaetia bacterium]|nr:hypothetical protein [Spirochaetota bacterium]MDW8112139.1 hypothetical protein [Spirochaetia bacterium]
MYIFIYLVVLVGLIVVLYRRITRSEGEYLVYGRRGGVFEITMSLTALVFGASSVFGLGGWAYKLGWNAIWWTLSGVVFLVILSIFFVKVVHSLKGYTIIDIIQEGFGKEVKFISSLILFVAWVSVLAGQVIAGANITQFVVGDRLASLIIFSSIFAVYTLIWGQVGAIKTSPLQVILMVFGLLILLYVSVSKLGPDGSLQSIGSKGIGFSEEFSLSLWLSIFVSVGLSYLFGPDIYSRIFSSKDYRIARLSLLLASFLIVVISVLIVSIGILGKSLLPDIQNPENVIPTLALSVPDELKPLILIALISIPLSGADVILLTSTSLVSKNIISTIFGDREVFTRLWFVRTVALVVILFATLVSLVGRGIIPMLLLAYKVFSSTVVPLIFLSILSKVFNRKVSVSNLGRVVIFVMLALSLVYIIVVELIYPQMKFDGYNMYLLLINLVVFWGVWLFGK